MSKYEETKSELKHITYLSIPNWSSFFKKNSTFLEKYGKSFSIASEKLHGCWFGICAKKDSNGYIKIGFSRRNDLLVESEGNYKFFKFEPLIPEFTEKVIELMKIIECDDIQVCGELVGITQTEIKYFSDKNDIKFYVFDIMVNGKLIPSLDMFIFAKKVGFNTVPFLGTDTFQNILDIYGPSLDGTIKPFKSNIN